MSHTRRSPCCESEAERFLIEEWTLAGSDKAIVTVDSLAAALHDRSMRCNQNRHYCADPDSPGSGHLRDARKLIKAAKEASDE